MNTALPKLKKAEYVEGYTVRLLFSDGTDGLVDLESVLWGEIFEPLKEPSAFRQFHLDPELETIAWPNGADLAPEFLYRELTSQ